MQIKLISGQLQFQRRASPCSIIAIRTTLEQTDRRYSIIFGTFWGVRKHSRDFLWSLTVRNQLARSYNIWPCMHITAETEYRIIIFNILVLPK